jgi:hypothetical protein
MKKAVIVGCLCVVLGGAVLSYLGVFEFGVLSSGGGNIEDFDKLVARVADAAKSGHVAARVASEDCQASIPLRIADLVRDYLDGKPAMPCASALEPVTPWDKPLAVVDLDHRRLDPIGRSLSAALPSPTPNAASTIVFIHCSKSETGHYGYIFVHAAYRQDCGLVFVGQSGSSAMQILGIRSFYALPPAKIDPRFTFGDVVADRPDSQMQDYIAYRWAEPSSSRTSGATLRP